MIEFLLRLTKMLWPEVWQQFYWRGFLTTVLVTYVVCGLISIGAMWPVFLSVAEQFEGSLKLMAWGQLVTTALVGWPMGITLSWIAVVAIILLLKWMRR